MTLRLCSFCPTSAIKCMSWNHRSCATNCVTILYSGIVVSDINWSSLSGSHCSLFFQAWIIVLCCTRGLLLATVTDCQYLNVRQHDFSVRNLNPAEPNFNETLLLLPVRAFRQIHDQPPRYDNKDYNSALPLAMQATTLLLCYTCQSRSAPVAIPVRSNRQTSTIADGPSTGSECGSSLPVALPISPHESCSIWSAPASVLLST